MGLLAVKVYVLVKEGALQSHSLVIFIVNVVSDTKESIVKSLMLVLLIHANGGTVQMLLRAMMRFLTVHARLGLLGNSVISILMSVTCQRIKVFAKMVHYALMHRTRMFACVNLAFMANSVSFYQTCVIQFDHVKTMLTVAELVHERSRTFAIVLQGFMVATVH